MGEYLFWERERFKFRVVGVFVFVVGRGLAPAVTLKAPCYSILFEVSAGASPPPYDENTSAANPQFFVFSSAFLPIHTAGRVLSVPVGEAVEFPSVPLVEGGVVGEEVEGGNALFLHVGADVIQQLPCQAPSAAVGFDIQGADIGSEVGAVVEVVGNDPRAADDAVTLQNGVPRGDGGLSRKGVGHTLLVGVVGDAPLIVEPGGQRGDAEWYARSWCPQR